MAKTWHPHIVGRVNDHDVKIAKIDGGFVFHAHPDTDELFYLLEGNMTMEFEDRPHVKMQPGEVLTVPRGVRHRPVAEHAQILMIERVGTINTGDETSDRTVGAEDARSEGKAMGGS
jgi:mannose-6-phosphate isomerase-like protein (cupin superfamily)